VIPEIEEGDSGVFVLVALGGKAPIRWDVQTTSSLVIEPVEAPEQTCKPEVSGAQAVKFTCPEGGGGRLSFFVEATDATGKISQFFGRVEGSKILRIRTSSAAFLVGAGVGGSVFSIERRSS
jgi:hypothetical protein